MVELPIKNIFTKVTLRRVMRNQAGIKDVYHKVGSGIKMKNIKEIVKFGSLLLLLSLLFVGRPLLVLADGGAVKSGGEIAFQGEVISSSESAGILPDTGGKLPQTGELVGASLLIGGVILILIVIFLFWKKRKDEEDEHENKTS